MVSRRGVLALGGGLVAAGAVGTARAVPAWARTPPGVAAPRLPDDLFDLGVASGDPKPGGAVIWTRLLPPAGADPLPDRDLPVSWQVAEDARFRRVVASGRTVAPAAWAHSVHVQVGGLRAARQHWYRFRGPDRSGLSPVGRFRTAPASTASPARLRWAVTSCQDYQAGLFTAWRDVAAQDLAFVAFLGDYVYETAPKRSGYVRRHEGAGEPVTLRQYRDRYAQYRADPDLQAAHAAHAFVVTIDDHEVDNNWAAGVPQDPARQSPAVFAARRAAALQAYWEHMPLPPSARPRGAAARLYRRLGFGGLASLSVLDTRQYRSDQAPTAAEAEAPDRTMTGAFQESWLLNGLTGSTARWNLVANQTMFTRNDRALGAAVRFDDDNWDAYPVQRRRILGTVAEAGVGNVVVLTGDRHATWVSDLHADVDDPDSPVVAAELTGTSISSGGNPDPAAFHRYYDPLMAESPHWRFIDNQRGYLLCDADDERMLTELRVVSTVTTPGGRTRPYAAFVTESGRPGVEVESVARRYAAQRARVEIGPAGPLPLDDGIPEASTPPLP